MAKKIKTGRGEFMCQLDSGVVVAWGWSFRPSKDAFRPAIKETPITVYAYTSSAGFRSDIVPMQIVGHARLAKDAAKIGSRAVRELVLPVLPTGSAA